MLQKFSSLDADVIIAGAGPVGLALALDLGRQGVSVIVLDAETGGPDARPNKRANAINTRAMEYMRRLGLSPQIHAFVASEPYLVRDVAFVTSLTGHELTRFVDAFESSPEPPEPGLSPEEYLRIDQDDIAIMLRREIGRLGNVTIREAWRLDGLTNGDASVTVEAQGVLSGERESLRAAYLIGADGGASTVRRQAGIGFDGEGGRGNNVNITFVSPEIDAANRHPEAAMFWIVNPRLNGFAGGNFRTWRLTLFAVSEEDEAQVRANPQPHIDELAGRPVAAEVVSIDRWTAHHLVARNYRAGRVFIAGDAAHLHPPTGGLGMNTGLGDASNLGWKLGAVIRGWAGPALLDSYDAERRPHGARVVAQSNHQYNLRPVRYAAEDLLDRGPAGIAARAEAGRRIRDEKGTEFFSRGLVLGQTYRSDAIIGDGTALVNSEVIIYTPTAQPGARLPHCAIASGSIYDAISTDGLTLVTVGRQDSGAFAALARDAGIPLKIVEAGPEMAVVYGARFVLVRPDGHVAWRGDAVIAAADLRRTVGRDPGASVQPAPVSGSASHE